MCIHEHVGLENMVSRKLWAHLPPVCVLCLFCTGQIYPCHSGLLRRHLEINAIVPVILNDYQKLWVNWHTPYPEPVYTGWSSVHWNATGMPLVDPVYTGTPLEKLSWYRPKVECHWRNLVESAPHWKATGETLTFAAYTGTPLEGLWQPTHAPTHIVKHAE